MVITAQLKQQPSLRKSVTIYIKKFDKEERLPTEQEVLEKYPQTARLDNEKHEVSKSRHKKWQVTYIAPLQPFTLAAFLPWGSSIGAGRIRLAGANL